MNGRFVRVWLVSMLDIWLVGRLVASWCVVHLVALVNSLLVSWLVFGWFVGGFWLMSLLLVRF